MKDLDRTINNIVTMFEAIPNKKALKQRIPYKNMAATITDSILQAGVNYQTVVIPRINMLLYRFPTYQTTCDFIILFQTYPLEEVLQWNNQRKLETIIELTWFLYCQQIENEKELSSWLGESGNRKQLLAINGIGLKTVDYLALLVGNQSIPIDRHMFKFLKMAGVSTKSYNEASFLLKTAANELGISESMFDEVVWNFLSR